MDGSRLALLSLPARLAAVAVGYQGEEHSYSYQACRDLYPDADPLGFINFPLALAALQEGTVTRLVLPIENSTTGSVLPVLDRLVGGGVAIVAEHLADVRHALLGVAGTKVSQIRTVLSHPEALAQAEASLVSRGWDPLPVHDTAGAVRLVAARGDITQAALAPAAAAAAYGLDVVMEDVVDRSHNTTRFVVLEKGVPRFEPHADKSTVAFETAHKPGALALALTELGLRGANLTRIESRPSDQAWRYRFFVDMLHAPGEAGFGAVFDPTPATMAAVHHLGTYPSA